MNKRSTTTVKAINYPDVLGTITNGRRLNLDVLQVAVATRPATINAGKPFEAIILLQNAADTNVDAVVRLTVPESDLGGQKGRFSTKIVKPIRVGLRPGEVGYANLPLLVTHQAKPGAGYKLELGIQVEYKQRNPPRVRTPNGGLPVDFSTLPETRQKEITLVEGMNYSVDTTGKVSQNSASLVAPFEVLPPVVSGLPPDLKPSYTTLWVTEDMLDEAGLAEKVKNLTGMVLPQLNRKTIFFPLLKSLQPRFEGAEYRLRAGEAVVISKLLTLVLETGVPQPGPGQEAAPFPRWFAKLCRLLNKDPKLATDLNQLVTEAIFPDLMYDAVLLGFTMLETVTREKFGSHDEMVAYAEQVVASLNGKGQPFDVLRVYLPLVLAGLLVNTRVVMPQEQPRDTLNLLATAVEKRAKERSQDNKFMFDMANDLIERALENF